MVIFEEGVDITLPFSGDYRYEVYQVPEEDSQPEDGVKVEEGKAEFNETRVSIPSYQTNFTAKVYEPSTAGS